MGKKEIILNSENLLQPYLSAGGVDGAQTNMHSNSQSGLHCYFGWGSYN